jgi:hypothetical protein
MVVIVMHRSFPGSARPTYLSDFLKRLISKNSGIWGLQTALSVMAALVPAIHVAPPPATPKAFRQLDDVGDRDEPGHDDTAVAAFASWASGR